MEQHAGFAKEYKLKQDEANGHKKYTEHVFENRVSLLVAMSIKGLLIGKTNKAIQGEMRSVQGRLKTYKMLPTQLPRESNRYTSTNWRSSELYAVSASIVSGLLVGKWSKKPADPTIAESGFQKFSYVCFGDNRA